MAKNYAQIVSGFNKTIKECQALSQALALKEKKTRATAAKLVDSAADMATERQRTESLEKKLSDLIGG